MLSTKLQKLLNRIANTQHKHAIHYSGRFMFLKNERVHNGGFVPFIVKGRLRIRTEVIRIRHPVFEIAVREKSQHPDPD